jgi:hypothetical protein
MSEQDIGKVTCKFCGETFNSVEDRTRHNEERHPEEAAKLREEQNRS